MILTIGITTHNENVFLEELLYILRQELSVNNLSKKVEILVANDFVGENKTKEIISKNSDILNFIEVKENKKTPAVGRNKIISKAKGKYILFMDGDDNFVSPLKDLVVELEEKETKDIFLSEVSKIVNDGFIIRSPFVYTWTLFNIEEEEFEKDFYKYAFHQTGIWSIYRTEFLKEKNLYYNEEVRYEDNLFMTNIALTEGVRYGRVHTKYYGWRTNLESFSNKDKEYVVENRIKLYELILEILSKNLDRKETPYLYFSVWNQTYSNIIRNYPVLTKQEYKNYFEKLNVVTKKYKKEIKEIRKVKIKKVDKYYKLRKYSFTDSFFLINSLKKLNSFKKSIRRIIKLYLKVFLILPMNKKKIFMTSQYGKYNDNTKYLYKELKENPKYKDYKFVFAVKDKELSREKDFINYNNKLKYYFHHYTAKEIYFNTWYEPSIVKRKNQVWTQLWHGIPYKKVYKDIETFYQTTPEFKIKGKEKSISNWDYVWSLNEYNTKIFENLFPNVKIIEKEYPKTNWLIKNNQNEKLKEELRIKHNLDKNKKYVLYAPTYRPYMLEINMEEVKNLVPKGYTLLFHPHPLLRASKVEGIKILEGIEDIQEIILITDAVISDYSSIKYDYEKTNKKIIDYKPDLEIYSKIHGLY